MKKILLLSIIAATTMFNALGQTTLADLSESARSRLDKAITLMDNGMAETAMTILENLNKEYPDNYDVLYEICYAHAVMGNNKEIVKLCKQLEQHPAANFQVFQMEGNALDNMGKRKDAIKTYQRGLERFPDAGLLYLEQAVIAMKDEDYNKAVDLLEQAVAVEPNLPAAYYRLAALFGASDEPVWGIIYGEAARLLSMDDERHSERGDQLSALVYNLYKDNLSITTQGDSTVLHATLTKLNTIDATPDSSRLIVPLPITFEHLMLMAMAPEKEVTLQSIIDARGRFIDDLYEILNGYYDVSILDYQRLVRESGHWQAYNMFLMGQGDVEAVNRWYESDPTAEAQIDAFATWYNEHPFRPTTQAPTLRTRGYKTANLGVPTVGEVSNAQDCRKHSDDALRLARWWLDQPADTSSYVIDQVQRFLITWSVNSDEIMLEVRDCCVTESSDGMFALIFAMIEYGLEHKVKNPGEEGFKYAVKRALAYLDKNRATIEVPERAEQALKMTPAQLDNLLHDEYNAPVETREMLM